MRVYQTAIEIGAKISKAFRSDTLAAAASIRKLAADTKKLEAAKKAAEGYKHLGSAVTKAKVKYDLAREALRRLEEAEKAAGGATTESTKWRKAGERAVAAAAREMDRATKAAEKNARALRALGLSTANVAKEQKRLAAAAQFATARNRLFGESRGKEALPLVQKAGEQIRGLARDVAVLGTATAGVGAGLIALVTRVGNAGDATAKMAKRVGIGVEALQELRYAGEREGASAEEVDKALARLTVTLGKARSAGKAAGKGFSIPGLQMLGEKVESGGAGGDDPFKRLGLNAKKLAALKPDEQIARIADAMGKLTDAQRAAAAQELLGQGGLALIPLLKGGSKAIEQYRREARQLGFVMEKDAIARSEDFNDAMTDAKLAASGVATTLGVALLPVATRTFQKITTWVKANREQIRAWAESAAKWIEGRAVPAVITIASEVKGLARAAADLAGWIQNKLPGGFKTVAVAAAALRLAPLALTLTKIGVEAVKAASALVKFAAASRGLGGGGAALGLLGKAGMVGAAGAAGFAAGTWLDEKTGLSDWISGTGRHSRVKASEDAADVERDRALAARVAAIRAQNEANRLRRAEAAGGGQTQISIHAPVTVGGTATREDIASGFDTAKMKALEDYERRVGFGGH